MAILLQNKDFYFDGKSVRIVGFKVWFKVLDFYFWLY